jgi:hypothetical protein
MSVFLSLCFRVSPGVLKYYIVHCSEIMNEFLGTIRAAGVQATRLQQALQVKQNPASSRGAEAFRQCQISCMQPANSKWGYLPL